MVKDELQRFYLLKLIPIVAFLFLALIIRFLLAGPWLVGKWMERVSILLVVCSAISALVLPLIYRLRIIKQFRDHKQVDHRIFISFQKTTIIISLTSLYIFIISLLIGASQLVYLGIFLISLYSAYFYFPGQKRISFERKMFRVKDV